jgi:hypothetical protein
MIVHSHQAAATVISGAAVNDHAPVYVVEKGS